MDADAHRRFIVMRHYRNTQLIIASLGTWLLKAGGQRATLDIDFVNDRANLAGSYVSIASLLSVTGGVASGSFYTKADGTLQSFANNVLRYGTSGLLVEESRENLCLQSQTLGTTWGVSNAAILADQTAAPDGTTTADLWTGNGAAYPSVFQTAIPATAGVAYTLSCYIKAGTATKACLEVRFSAGDDSSEDVEFDLTGSGTATPNGASTLSPTGTILALANGWYRCTMTKTAPASTTTCIVIMRGGAIQTPTSTTVYFWGAQVEAGAFATSYIPTTTVAVARAADIITFADLTWLGGTADSIYAQWVAKNVNNAKVWAFDATADKLLDEQTGMSARIAGATVATTAAAGATVKAAARLVLDDYAITMNGGTIATDVSETAPGTLSASRLGCDLAGANHLNSYIKRVAAFKGVGLSSAALQALAA